MTFDAKDWASSTGRYDDTAEELTRMGQGIQDAHAQMEWVLAALGYMDSAIESAPRSIDSTLTLASGRADFSYVTAYRTLTITQLGTATRSTAATGVTGIRRGLYRVEADGALTLVARTALLAAGYASQWTEYVHPLDVAGGFPASYTMEAGKRYAFGHWMTFTGVAPAMRGYATNAPSALLNRPPKAALAINGQADLALSYTAGQAAVAAGNALYLFGLA